MSELHRERLGSPDISLGGFELWVHSRQFPDAQDEWDGNWLMITARCSVAGAVVWAQGPIADTVGIARFAMGLGEIIESGSGQAQLASVEPEVSLQVTTVDRLGHLVANVDITPDVQHQSHQFEFEIDQTYLTPLLAQCRALLEQYPVRNPAGRGL